MTVAVVVESQFGNTYEIGQAIAQGVSSAQILLWRAEEAPLEIPESVDTLFVGGPTHNSGLSSSATRKQAAAQGAQSDARRGIREWIGEFVPRSGLRVLTFDTSVRSRFSFGSASKSAAKLLRKRIDGVEQGLSFYVGGTAGPILPGESDRARSWGEEVVRGRS